MINRANEIRGLCIEKDKKELKKHFALIYYAMLKLFMNDTIKCLLVEKKMIEQVVSSMDFQHGSFRMEESNNGF